MSPTATPVDFSTWLSAWIREPKTEIPTATVAVALTLAAYAQADGGNAWPSQSTLAAAVGICRVTAGRALVRLTALGWIERTSERQGRRPNTYRLALPASR